MAMDLANSAPEDSGAEKVEASRMRKRSYSSRRRMGSGRGRRRGFSEERPRARRSMAGRRREFSDTERLERIVRQQRRELAAMRRQLSEIGAQPGAAPTVRRHSAPVSNEPLNVGGSSARQRVFNQLKDKFRS